MKCDDTRAETRFRLSAKRTSPFKSAGASVQSSTGSRGVRISGSVAGYTMFRGSVKSAGCPLHSPVSRSLPLSCVTVCHHISTALYNGFGGTCSFRLLGGSRIEAYFSILKMEVARLPETYLSLNQTTRCLVPEYSYLKTTKIKTNLFARFFLRGVRKFSLAGMSVKQ